MWTPKYRGCHSKTLVIELVIQLNSSFSLSLSDQYGHVSVRQRGSDLLWLCWWDSESVQPHWPALYLYAASPSQPGHRHCHCYWGQVRSATLESLGTKNNYLVQFYQYYCTVLKVACITFTELWYHHDT